MNHIRGPETEGKTCVLQHRSGSFVERPYHVLGSTVLGVNVRATSLNADFQDCREVLEQRRGTNPSHPRISGSLNRDLRESSVGC